MKINEKDKAELAQRTKRIMDKCRNNKNGHCPCFTIDKNRCHWCGKTPEMIEGELK